MFISAKHFFSVLVFCLYAAAVLFIAAPYIPAFAASHTQQDYKIRKQTGFFSRKKSNDRYYEKTSSDLDGKKNKTAAAQNIPVFSPAKPERQIRLNLAVNPLIYVSARDLQNLLGAASAPIQAEAKGWASLLQSREKQLAGSRFMCARLAPSAFRDKTHIYAEKNIIAVLTRYYTRSPALIWSDTQGNLYPRSERLLEYLAQTADDGLKPVDYMPPKPCSQIDAAEKPAECANQAEGKADISLIEFDFALSARLLRYIEDMQNGRVKARSFAGYYNLPPKPLDLDSIFLELSQSSAPADILASYRPQSSVYAALQKEFLDLGKIITANADKNTAAQNSTDAERKQQAILYSMERLRWLPQNFPPRNQDYIFINVPAMQAQFFSGGSEKLSMKAVVGSPSNPTNSFYSKIERVVFNPSWGVPFSILKNEMARKIARDPSYPARAGYEVYYKGQQIDPRAVDWEAVAQSGGVNIRQKPGTNNALGKLKILFPNPYNIYLHDTPSKYAFAQANRAISHGCVRLAQPEAMAAAVLNTEQSRLEPYFKRSENSVTPPRAVDVYLTYFTAWPQNAAEDKNISYYRDIYGLDSALQQAEEAVSSIREQYRLTEQNEREKSRPKQQASQAGARFLSLQNIHETAEILAAQEPKGG